MLRSIVPVAALALSLSTAGAAEPERPALDKKATELHVSADLPFPAEVVWNAIAVDFGRIAQSHPLIVSSEYLHGSLEGELGVERSCVFNDKGTRTLTEQIVGWDPEAMEVEIRVLEASGFPLDPDNTLAVYSVTALGAGSSRITSHMTFRAKPAIMTGLMAGSFENLLQNYFVALEHHLATGESVTRDNFKAIARDAARADDDGAAFVSPGSW